MSKMKYKKKEKRLHNEKIAKNQIPMHFGEGGCSQFRSQAAELKQTVKRQFTCVSPSMCPES
jgi:hypothetical protein